MLLLPYLLWQKRGNYVRVGSNIGIVSHLWLSISTINGTEKKVHCNALYTGINNLNVMCYISFLLTMSAVVVSCNCCCNSACSDTFCELALEKKVNKGDDGNLYR
uniref:Uncharacterized protein n=1 Tax=Glossina brevipalpis TaxID=37001 RepID=A0A1A9WQA2_9MUSC